MGMLETQLSEVNEKKSEMNAKLEAALYDLSQKDEIVSNMEEKLKEVQSAISEAEMAKRDAGDAQRRAQ
jgi:chromosome segregation ATPase